MMTATKAPTRKMTKKALNEIADRVAKMFGQECYGVQVSIWDLGKVSKVGAESIMAGDDDATTRAKLRAFVETIRVGG
jgi:hypothetical protein